MKQRILIATIVVVTLGLSLCCWSVMRSRNERAPQQHQEVRTFREKLADQATLMWGKRNIRVENLQGPEDALTLSLQAAEGSCSEPAIRQFILHVFGYMGRIKTIICNESNKSISFDVGPYREKIRAIFPMIPDKPDTRVMFGGTVTEMSPGVGDYERTEFKSRQELIDYLQIEPRGLQFGTPSKTLHPSGFRLYAAEEDDRILVIETVACDMLEYRIIHIASVGLSRTTVVRWTELGGTFLVCKGKRDVGILSMQAASESLGLYPVNSIAECARLRVMDRCN